MVIYLQALIKTSKEYLNPQMTELYGFPKVMEYHLLIELYPG
jgi:hypothetical protein